MWEQILRNINLYYRKSEFSNLEDKKIKESQFTAKELDSLSKLAKHQHYDAYDFTGTSAFDEFESPMDDFFICKTEYGYFLVKTEGYNYCRYIIPLDDNLSKKILNKYNKFFESRKNKMKLTTKEKQLVKEYAKKLVGKRSINESPIKKLKLSTDTDWEPVIGADPAYDELSAAQTLTLKTYLEKNYTESEITKAINNFRTTPNWLLPSGWPMAGPGYPALLARALNASEAAEPLSDIGNIYYSKRNISKEAILEFEKALYADPKHPFGKQGLNDMEEMFPDKTDDVMLMDYLKSPIIKKFMKKFYPEYS